MPLLRYDRRAHSCAGWRRQTWPGRTDPDVSLSGLPHHVHCPAPHSPVPSENPLSAGRTGALRAGRRAGSFGCRAGLRLPTSHDHCFRNLHLPHLQLDELRTRLWLAIDPCTKILPVLSLGPRTQYIAHLLIHSLRQILAPGCLPLFTSDGLNLYFYALTAHFGDWLQVRRRGRYVRQWQVAAGLIYGQVKKCYQRRKLVRVTRVMQLGTQADLIVALQRLGFSGRLNTAFIERVNLTVRHGVSALARRTWATAQQTPQLSVH